MVQYMMMMTSRSTTLLVGAVLLVVFVAGRAVALAPVYTALQVGPVVVAATYAVAALALYGWFTRLDTLVYGRTPSSDT